MIADRLAWPLALTFAAGLLVYWGVVVVIDPSYGPADYQQGIRTLPEGLPLWAPLGAPTRQKHGFYAYPWALNEDQALCSYESRTDQSDPAGYGLYLVDRHGNQELIHRDPVYACLMPIPIQARPLPPVLPVMRTPGAPAVCALVNVYAGTDFLKPGEAKYLRISQNEIWPYTVEDGQMRYRYDDQQCENYSAKRIIGDEYGCVKAMECVRYELGEPDESGRRRLLEIKGSELYFFSSDIVTPCEYHHPPLLRKATTGLPQQRAGMVALHA